MDSNIKHCQGCGIPEDAAIIRYRWSKGLQALQPRDHGAAVLVETDLADHDRRLLCQLCRAVSITKRCNLAVTGLATPAPVKQKPAAPDDRQLPLIRGGRDGT